MSRRPAASLALVLCGLALGCGDLGIGPEICDRPESDTPRLYSGGFISGNTYMSSAWTGDWLHFPGGAYYKIRHGLGAEPNDFAFWLSFNPHGTLGSGKVSEAAGNQIEIDEIDSEYLTVINSSCAEYYLLVIARVDGLQAAGGAPGGGGSGAGGGGGN